MNMQRVLLAVLGTHVMIFSLLVAPTECVAEDPGRADPLQKGAWAIQFGITSDFTLNSFSGGIMSMKRHFSSRSALRGGLSGSLESLDGVSQWSDPDTTASEDTDRDAAGLGIELQYLYYSRPINGLSLYWGTGPSYRTNRDESGYSADGRESRRTRHQWSLGLLNSLGVEWFPAKFVGIHAEYGLALEYVSQSTEDNYLTELGRALRNSELDGWRVDDRPVRFGVSVYF